MPPVSKKFKTEAKSPLKGSELDLHAFQNEIKKIRGQVGESQNSIQFEHDYRLIEDRLDDATINSSNNEEIKEYIREQIHLSEQRIHQRFDSLEQKLNTLINRRVSLQAESDEAEEWIEEDQVPKIEVCEIDSSIFPIADEDTFDWFFQQLRSEEYRNALIANRWHLANTVNKSFNISVKDFLQMHFELTVCVKYSVSGFGAHGIKKKKLDLQSLNNFVFECFNVAFPGLHSHQETSKAIVQFWGRSPDYLNKANDRANRRKMNDHVI